MWLVAATPLAGQGWQPGAGVPLLELAAEARAARDADAQLASWQATASGVVRFALMLGHGADSKERVVRADELRVEVYGEAPNRSKQVIVAWRDTSLAPTRIVYHRDHLGIVANDFGPVIRLGEGDEVRDVPHPLSAAGLRHYEFRIGDTVAVSGPRGMVRVVSVAVRPTDQGGVGAVGTMQLDLERGALVRFLFTFTAPSYRDPTVQHITVVLENALLDGQRWLPWRQTITIRRDGPVLALPMHTLLRAEWIIDDYQLGVVHPEDRFQGALVAGLRRPADGEWQAPLEATLGALPITSRDVEPLVANAAAIAPAARLDGLPSLRLLGDRGLSSLLRVTRVQGVTPGAGAALSLDERWHLELVAALGLSDRRVTGSGTIRRRLGRGALAFTAGREVVDVGGGAFGSGWANSIATAVSGADAGDWFLRTHATVGWERRDPGGPSLGVSSSLERIGSLTSRFTALDGTRRPNPQLGRAADRVSSAAWLAAGSQAGPLAARLRVEESAAPWWIRVALSLGGTVRPLVWQVDAGVGSEALPPDRAFVAGGRGSLVGVPHRAIGGRRLIRAELALPIRLVVPSPGPGRIAGDLLPSRVAPYLAAAVAGGDIGSAPWRATGRVEPLLGLRFDLWGPLVRIDVGWALRRGTIGITLDAHPDWWPLL